MTRLHREFPAKAESLYWRAPRTTVRGHVRPIFLETPTMKHAMPFVARLPLSLGLAAALLAGCAAPRPESGPADVAVPLVILDTDVGSSTDDLFALEMLYRYEDAGKCRLLGVVVDRPGEANAAFVNAMNAWAGRPELPVALVRRGPADAKVFIDYARVADAADASGRPLFPRTAPGDRPDGAALYRRLLADAPDGSVTICSIGFLTALAQLLESPPDGLSPLGGAELVRRKVARAVVMGGAFADGAEPEYNFAMDPESARTFFRLWPRDVEIVFSPAEVGDAIDYPPALVVSDLSGPTATRSSRSTCSATATPASECGTPSPPSRPWRATRRSPWAVAAPSNSRPTVAPPSSRPRPATAAASSPAPPPGTPPCSKRSGRSTRRGRSASPTAKRSPAASSRKEDCAGAQTAAEKRAAKRGHLSCAFISRFPT